MVMVVVVPAVAAVGAPTAAAVVVSIMVQQRSSLPKSGAVPAVPTPRNGTRILICGRSPPTMEGALSRVPVSSGLSMTCGLKSTWKSPAIQSVLAGVPAMASVPGVVSILAAAAENRMRTRDKVMAISDQR